MNFITYDRVLEGAATSYDMRLHVIRCSRMLDIITYSRILQHVSAYYNMRPHFVRCDCML